MNPKPNWVCVGLVIAFCIGCFAGKLFQVEGWALKKEIDPLQIVSILVSIFIVIYISIRLENIRDRSKVKKEIIVKKSDYLISLIRDLTSKVGASEVCIVYAASIFKEVHTDFDSFKYFVEKSNMSNKSVNDEFIKRLRKARNLATNTPTKSSPNQHDISVKDGRLFYSSYQVGRIKRELVGMERVIIDEQIRLIDA